MAAYSKTTITSGDTATAAWANAIQTQYDCVVTEATAGNIPVGAAALTGTIAAARLPARTATIFLSAAGGKPRTTGGCAPVAWTELATNKIMVPSLDFDTASDEYAQWMFTMPDGYAGGHFFIKPYWTAASGSGTACWSFSGRALDNDGALDQALGSAATSTDTLITANDVHIGPEADVTLAGSPGGGQLVIIECMRDVSGDTLGVDARLLGIKIEFSTAYGD